MLFENYFEKRAAKYVYKAITYEKLLPIVSAWYKRRLIFDYGIWIGRNVNIGENLILPHPQGIVIGNNVNLGKNVTIYQQVTIGRKNGKYPYVGSGCVFFPGSKILGDIKICDNTTVAPNAVVISSTEKNSIYAGVPAKRVDKI